MLRRVTYPDNMSCIRFNTPAQRAQLDRLASDPKLSAESVAQFLSPEITDSKIARLKLMASSRNVKIRESAALSIHLPDEDRWLLARDVAESVRVCVARNESTPCDILRHLAADPSETVRGWVAVNYFVPADTMEVLALDEASTVRALVSWKKELAETS